MEHFSDTRELDIFLDDTFAVLEKGEDGKYWKLRLEGEANQYKVHLRWLDENLLLTVDPYGPPPRDKECAARLHHYLLAANDEMRWGFFSIDRDYSVELNINLPQASLNDQVLKRALDHLLFYGDRHYFNVLNLANSAQAKVVIEDD
ncbi:hypothetical protein KKF84_10565 [Myxococcota bacterium]|nr:hypothetical protein [Myxococcota bacterium]MBU1535754.1 hypothetical protein [Myxococcota bacterium]